MPPIVQVQDLHKTYRTGRLEVHAVRGVSLTVERGEFLAVMGPSGSGKSTLFHVIGGLTSPSSGHVQLGGVDLATLGDTRPTPLRQKRNGFRFQRFNFLCPLA